MGRILHLTEGNLVRNFLLQILKFHATKTSKFQTIILVASLVKQCLNPAEYSAYKGCDPLNPTEAKDWTHDVPFPWWAQIIGAIMVMLPVLPMPIIAIWHFARKRIFYSADNCVSIA